MNDVCIVRKINRFERTDHGSSGVIIRPLRSRYGRSLNVRLAHRNR